MPCWPCGSLERSIGQTTASGIPGVPVTVVITAVDGSVYTFVVQSNASIWTLKQTLDQQSGIGADIQELFVSGDNREDVESDDLELDDDMLVAEAVSFTDMLSSTL
jgi:hypothetical protein